MSKNITILGAGSWGIALAKLLCENGHTVCVWSALPDEIQMLRENNEHLSKLPGVKLPKKITYVTKLSECVSDKDMLVMAVPSVFIRPTAKSLTGLVDKECVIVNVAKGIEESTLYTMSQIIEEELPKVEVAVLSGPSHAEEVSRKLPTTVVAGADNEKTARFVQETFSNDYFRVYVSPDVASIELGAALKNVVALAAGIADGIGCGDNTKAALITRGISEISRLGAAMGGDQKTFYGLSGIGDLIVTCASVHSRNRRAGVLIGQGKSLDEAIAEVKMVVEGVYSAKAGLALSKKYHVEMPIIEKTCAILFEGKDPKTAVYELMVREQKPEVHDVLWESLNSPYNENDENNENDKND